MVRKKDVRLSARGSLTVEAAMILAVFLIVWISVVQMTFYLTDAVRMDAVLAEGNLKLSEDPAAARRFMRDSDGYFYLHSSGVKNTSGPFRVTSGKREKVSVGGRSLLFEAEWKRSVRHPVTWIHLLRSIR